MSFDTRNNSAMYKRAEQLKRWEESDTNREPPEPKNLSSRKIKFSSGCVFLAACMSADRAEVLRLLDNGADIDTVNVDGLTALHQACIDDNLEMVEFLVQQGADVNRQDNEGWTPLHATSSCGFLSIANYLIENGADLAAVSGDGELAIDVAESNRMEELLQKYINEKGIDCDEARQSEERQMLTDAKNWLRGDASKADEPHPRTGATALHVAAAKGYSKVLSLLLATRADVDKQDNDGWTPLHAAAHWGQKEAAQMLVAALADMDVKNYAGQTPIDVADPSMIRFLEDLKKNNKRSKRRPISQIRISDNMDNHIETPSKVIRVDGNEDKPKPPTEPAALVPKDSNSVAEDDAPWRRSGSLRTRAQQESPPKTNVPERESVPADSDVILRRTQSFEEDEKKTVLTPIVSSPSTTTPPVVTQPGQVRRSFVPPVRDEESETQRKAHAKRVRETRRSTQGVTLDEIKSAEELVKKKNMNNNNNDSETPTSTAINDRVPTIQTTEGNISQQSSTDVQSTSPTDHVTATYTINAPTSSARVDDKVTATYTINPPPTSTSPSSNTVSFSAIVPIAKSVNESKDTELVESTISATINVPPPSNAKTDLEMLTKTASPTIAQTNFKFDSSRSSDTTEESTKPVENDVKLEFPFTKSHRDKRSLFDMDNAASLSLAEKLRNEANKYSNNDVSSIVGNKHLSGKAEDNERKSDSTPSSPAHHGMAAERRPSWRLKFDAGSKFKLEDVPASNITSTSNNIISSNNTTPVGSTISQRRQINSNSNPSPPTERPVSAPVISTANSELSNDRTKENTSEVTLSLRRPKSSSEDKENDKENDSRTAQATQAVIQRRRRPKRRSTGVVHVDMDDIDPERQDGDIDDKESGSESRTSRSRLGSTSSLASEQNDAKSDSAAENGDIDYKALYEASRLENEKLKTQLKKKEDDLSTAKATVDRFTNATTKNSLSELEKRERRAMERKLSEMEEELKLLQKYKTENERLRAENRALTRVVSKLTTSAQSQLHNKQ
ncbi:protein phosphatase 1 regulatory subunit 12C isoform X13 [Bradysia coprophila]|uniref:protein phosphatase 1 regulatory subunit 12C isoform X13 n=1 Tax=Bradysia coprophila TaxID=38358 RepID=UPI00187DD544|nr:protein phosphatase 1 regulatory subunit 12C isoform X13 [Bradysia coprophila]